MHYIEETSSTVNCGYTVDCGEKHPESNGFSFLSPAIEAADILEQVSVFPPVGQRSLRREHRQEQ